MSPSFSHELQRNVSVIADLVIMRAQRLTPAFASGIPQFTDGEDRNWQPTIDPRRRHFPVDLQWQLYPRHFKFALLPELLNWHVLIRAIRIPTASLWRTIVYPSHRRIVLWCDVIVFRKIIITARLAVNKSNAHAVNASLPAACPLIVPCLFALVASCVASWAFWNVLRRKICSVGVKATSLRCASCVSSAWSPWTPLNRSSESPSDRTNGFGFYL